MLSGAAFLRIGSVRHVGRSAPRDRRQLCSGDPEFGGTEHDGPAEECRATELPLASDCEWAVLELSADAPCQAATRRSTGASAGGEFGIWCPAIRCCAGALSPKF